MLHVTDQESEAEVAINHVAIVYLTPNQDNENQGTIIMKPDKTSVNAIEEYDSLKRLLPQFIEIQDRQYFLDSETGPTKPYLINPNALVSYTLYADKTISTFEILLSCGEKLLTNEPLDQLFGNETFSAMDD